MVVNYLLGKDMALDTLSYHLYAGFSAVNDRFAQDYFPAGPNSYFNPYVYVPLYYLVKYRPLLARDQFGTCDSAQRHAVAYLRTCPRRLPVG